MTNVPSALGLPPAPYPAIYALHVEAGHTPFTRPSKFVWIGDGGSVTLLMAGDARRGGDPVTLKNVQSGTMLELSVVQIIDATAEDIVVFF